VSKPRRPSQHIITGVETIKRQTGCVRLVGHRSACGRRLSLRFIGPTPAQSVTWTSPLKLRYATWGAIQVLYAFAYMHLP